MPIYDAIAAVFCLILVGFVFLFILWVLDTIFVIITSIQASDGKYRYPCRSGSFSKPNLVTPPRVCFAADPQVRIIGIESLPRLIGLLQPFVIFRRGLPVRET
jgi:hypothetical protein